MFRLILPSSPTPEIQSKNRVLVRIDRAGLRDALEQCVSNLNQHMKVLLKLSFWSSRFEAEAKLGIPNMLQGDALFPLRVCAFRSKGAGRMHKAVKESTGPAPAFPGQLGQDSVKTRCWRAGKGPLDTWLSFTQIRAYPCHVWHNRSRWETCTIFASGSWNTACEAGFPGWPPSYLEQVPRHLISC